MVEHLIVCDRSLVQWQLQLAGGTKAMLGAPNDILSKAWGEEYVHMVACTLPVLGNQAKGQM